VPRIGFLGPPPGSSGAQLVQSFQQGLRELGYIEGRNITIEYRWTDVDPRQLDVLAAELVRLRIDVLVASVTPVIAAAKRATATIPIVMANAADPVGSGFVKSLVRPGGNVTGLSRLVPEVIGKELELLTAAVPGLARIGVFSIGDGMFFLNRSRLANLLLKTRLPSMFSNTAHVEAGGLMSYAASARDNYRRAAYFVDKILKGAKPAEPVEQPTKFEFVINLKTTKALGLTIPQTVLQRADVLLL
jgi:putative tryptophan/tyrosine transport system substrate-binding protein